MDTTENTCDISLLRSPGFNVDTVETKLVCWSYFASFTIDVSSLSREEKVAVKKVINVILERGENVDDDNTVRVVNL